jgi:aryl-alcohol dehydrogenase-like predicted oxidoreductase
MTRSKRPKTYGSKGIFPKTWARKPLPPLSRRSFVKLAGLAGAGALNAPLMAKQAYINQLAGPLEYRNHRPDLMSYRRLGKTNLMVSTLALGGASNYGNGGPGATSDPSAYQAMMQRLLDLGINHFDTSPQKGSESYDTEDKFAFLCTPQNREKVFISTKVDSVAPSELKQSVDESLAFMQTDTIDILYIHNSIGVTGQGDYSGMLGALDAMDQLKADGKIRFSGVSSHSVSVLSGLLNQYADRVDVILSFYTPTDNWAWATDPLADWEPVYQLAREKDIGVVAMKVLMSGQDRWADRAAALEQDTAAMARLRPFLDAGHSLPQACVQWALSNDAIHSCVLGMRTMAEAEEDAGAVEPTALRPGPQKAAGPALRIHSFPNPFNEFTTLHFNPADGSGRLHVSIMDASGRLVRDFNAGSRRIVIWDGRDTGGQRVAPGSYIVSARCGGLEGRARVMKV